MALMFIGYMRVRFDNGKELIFDMQVIGGYG